MCYILNTLHCTLNIHKKFLKIVHSFPFDPVFQLMSNFSLLIEGRNYSYPLVRKQSTKWIFLDFLCLLSLGSHSDTALGILLSSIILIRAHNIYVFVLLLLQPCFPLPSCTWLCNSWMFRSWIATMLFASNSPLLVATSPMLYVHRPRFCFV